MAERQEIGNGAEPADIVRRDKNNKKSMFSCTVLVLSAIIPEPSEATAAWTRLTGGAGQMAAGRAGG